MSSTYINKNETVQDKAEFVSKFLRFCLSYPEPDAFVGEIWGDGWVGAHMQDKFRQAYDSAGSTGAMVKFWSELSKDNQEALEAYAIEWASDNNL